ncbi:MAG: diaminopimelate epimerase [Myxococcota bacterium]
MRFSKYQGTGNDFIVLDKRAGGAPLSAEVVMRLCDRHRGIGADGVLTLWKEPEHDFRMQVQNADGSESEMCGNGLRCVARFVHDRDTQGGDRLTVRSGDGTYVIERVAAGVYRVDMGRPTLDSPQLPPESRGRAPFTLMAGEARFDALALSFGNPHAVIFTPEDPMQLAVAYGAQLERHPSFPERVNVSFARSAAPGRFEAVVFERGSGITQACGSGACAVAIAAVWSGRTQRDQAIEIALPGGVLTISVDAGDRVLLQGPAELVFTGEVDETRLR